MRPCGTVTLVDVVVDARVTDVVVVGLDDVDEVDVARLGVISTQAAEMMSEERAVGLAKMVHVS
jgi:hypothetical protein